MDKSVFDEKSPFEILGFSFSPKLDWGSHAVSTGKTGSKKIGAMIYSMKCISFKVALHNYKSIIGPSMECCYHVKIDAAICNLDMMDKLQMQICRTVGLILAASFEPLGHYQNIGSFIFMFHFFYHVGGLIVIVVGWKIFLSPFLGL